MGHKQTLILLEIHVKMVENSDQFRPFLEKCQQVGGGTNRCVDLHSASIYSS